MTERRESGLVVEDRGHVRLLTLDRPERRNALSSALQADLVAELLRAPEDGDVRAMLLTGEYVTSEDAARWGLVNRLVDADDVLPTAMALAERIAANAPLSVRRMKETAVKGLELPLWQALRLDVGPNPYLSEDRREGIAAYLEKRPPRWSGR